MLAYFILQREDFSGCFEGQTLAKLPSPLAFHAAFCPYLSAMAVRPLALLRPPALRGGVFPLIALIRTHESLRPLSGLLMGWGTIRRGCHNGGGGGGRATDTDFSYCELVPLVSYRQKEGPCKRAITTAMHLSFRLALFVRNCRLSATWTISHVANTSS